MKGIQVRRVLGCFPLLLGLLFFSTHAISQSSVDDIHVAPRVPAKAVSAAPESADAPLKSHTPAIKKDVQLVLVPVTITDDRDRLVTGLDKENFQVFEGKQQQEIRHFSSEDAPVSLGIIFDVSGSMTDKMERAKEAVMEFCRSANPQDEFFMITFSDRPQIVTHFTDHVEDVQNKLAFSIPKGRTALLDAIYLGMSEMRQAQRHKKALLIISDGGDNHSRYTESEINSLVKEGDVMIYGIGIYDRNFPTQEEALGPQLLSDIAEETGGRAFTIENPNDLPDVAGKIGMQIRNQYVLGYRPEKPPKDGKWHKIKVKIRPPKGLPRLQVYSKTGYYAAAE